jgi:hypothetical protein
MKSEESVLTDFNFYFITFPQQVFVNIFDKKLQKNWVESAGLQTFLLSLQNSRQKT